MRNLTICEEPIPPQPPLHAPHAPHAVNQPLQPAHLVLADVVQTAIGPFLVVLATNVVFFYLLKGQVHYFAVNGLFPFR